jgi:hypothetical protein
MSQNYPYLFGGQSIDSLDHNTVFALSARGFFSPANGFKKLGFIYEDCFPEMNGKIMGWLHQVGLSSSQIVTYNLSCPSAFASPSDLEQAVLQFQRAGVTHVTNDWMDANLPTFTNIAEQQGFRPKYGLPDEGLIVLNASNNHPNYANMAGAIAISGDRWAEMSTPGYVPSAGTQKCNAIFAAHGQPPMYRANDAGNSGWACDGIWELAAMIDHAPALHRNALALGLQAAGSVDMSFPTGPNDFRGAKVTVGDQFWRAAEFLESCTCWRANDQTWHPAFK